jgi:PAS domain S-box-containing protein
MILESNDRVLEGQPQSHAPSAAPLDPVLGGLARLAANACGSPLASIAIMGCGEVWSSATAQLTLAAVPRLDPFACYTSHAVGLFEVSDATLDNRFRESEAALGFAIRSYAGCVLSGAGGETLGTLAVFDKRARVLSTDERTSLLLIAEQVVARIADRARLAELALLANVNPTAAALMESAPVAIYHTDAAGNMVYANPEYRRMFGLKLGHSPDAWAELVHPDDRRQMEQSWDAFCRHPVPVRFNYRTQAKDGAIRHLSEQVVAAEGVPGWVGTISYVSDLVAARDNLRKAETLFTNTFDQAPLGIVYTDRSGRLLRFNPAFCTMLGFEADELANRALGDITGNEDLTRVAAELDRLWNGEAHFLDLEKRFKRKDGSLLWVRTTTVLVREHGATPEYSVEFLRDISARKETAAELERVNKQLMSASRQAGMAEVATNVLHNVGNILNSINISASIVIERVKQSKAPGVSRLAALLEEKGAAVDDARVPEYLKALGEQLMSDQKVALEELASLRDNLDHIKETVAMQQSYAKLCGVTETIAVADLVEDSLRLNAGAFVRHGVTLRREFNEVPPITVDKHKVLQILVNLVRNAKYACDESGRADKLLILRIERAPAGVRVGVIDNGVGIAPENMHRLFTHGFTTRASGHGFGLHSGALAAQELGGTLSVKSDGPGRGATFTLELPYDAADAKHV